MNVTVLVSCSVDQGTIDSLTAGTMVSLQRQPDNEKDPYAVQVFLNEKPIGYLANRKTTLIVGTSPAAKISQHLEKPNVAGCYAKLVNLQPYGEENKLIRWAAELFWLPVWDDGKAGEKKPLILKVGGTKVLHNNISTVMAAIDDYKGGKLILTLSENGNTGLVPTVWIAGTEKKRGSSPAGQVQNPPAELISALSRNGSLRVEPVKMLDKGNYQIEVKLEACDMSDFFNDMEDVIKRGVMQARDVKERVKYLLEQVVPEHIIHGVLQNMKPNESNTAVIRPKQLFLQTAENDYLTRTIGYHLTGQNVRLIGEKGSGKNTLVYSVCWVMNQPLCRIQGNAETDKIDILGGQTLDDHGTRFELSGFIKMLIEGGDVVLDEINTIKPEIAILLHSLADDARSIEVPGYGFVEIHPKSRIWATMNEAYIGTGNMNEATADRFMPVKLADQKDLGTLLTEIVPTAKEDDVKICVTLYNKIKKAVKDGKCAEDAITIRGYIDALKSLKWLPLRAVLMDSLATRPQDPDDQQAVADFIRAIIPA